MQITGPRFGGVTPFKLTDENDNRLTQADNPQAWELTMRKLQVLPDKPYEAVYYNINGFGGPIRMDYFLTNDEKGNHLEQYQQKKMPAESIIGGLFNKLFGVNPLEEFNNNTVENLLVKWRLNDEVDKPRSFVARGEGDNMTVVEK